MAKDSSICTGKQKNITGAVNEILRLCMEGQKNIAITKYRQWTGTDLTAAVHAVNELERTAGKSIPEELMIAVLPEIEGYLEKALLYGPPELRTQLERYQAEAAQLRAETQQQMAEEIAQLRTSRAIWRAEVSKTVPASR